MAGRREKRWLKSVADPDLVEFFEDSEFDAAEYAKGFYEQREASHAGQRVEKLEGLKRQTEEALRAEVVRNYKAFMLATEEIRSMETGIQTLKDLLASTSVTLQTFRSVRLLEPKPTEKGPTGRPTRLSGGGGRAGDSAVAPGVTGGGDEDGMPLEGDLGPSRGLKLPEWLDQAPIELEELLLERKHQAAASLIRRVREFAGNVQNATNLGRGVERIFQRVETMASGMADRLLAEIAAANTLTVWGFREHKSNFALLIALGHGEKAAVSFVGERSAMIRRSLRLVEATADPLSYVGTLSETFFGQVSDAVTAFLKLFCGPSKIHHRRATKTGKSVAYYQVLQGQRSCGTAPFCRLVVWVNEQIDQYSLLVGRQIRGVTMGPQKVTRVQSTRKLGMGSGVGAGGAAGSGGGSSSSPSWAAGNDEMLPRLGPLASSLFSIVSLILEEAFAAAATLNTYGFPVGVQLASRLVPDVTHFMSCYVDNVKDNVVEAIRKDAFVATEMKLLPPEALASGTVEEEEQKAQTARLTSSARIMVLEARDILDYALILLEPPPPEDETLAAAAAASAAASEGTASTASTIPASPPGSGVPEPQVASYYTRDEFLELQPVIVKNLERLLRTYLKESTTCVRARREDLSSNQLSAAASNLSEIGGIYMPQLGAWCTELLPEISDEEEVANLRALELEFQRSASNPIRPKDSSAPGARNASSSARSANRSSWSSAASSSPSAGNPGNPAAAATASVATAGAAALSRASVGSSSRMSAGSSVGRLSVVSSSSGVQSAPTAGAVTELQQSAGEGEEGGGAPTEKRRSWSLDPETPAPPPSSGVSAVTSAASAAAEAAMASATAARNALPPAGTRPKSGRAPGASSKAGSHSRSGSSSSAGKGATGSGRSSPTTTPSQTEVITSMDSQISAKKVPAVASRYLAATSGGGRSGSGDGSSPPLPSSMRRPAMTFKAAKAAADAKAKAAAEAKVKAEAEAKEKAAVEAKARAAASKESSR